MNIRPTRDAEMTADEAEKLAQALEKLAARVRASKPKEATLDRSWEPVDPDPYSRQGRREQGPETCTVEIKW